MCLNQIQKWKTNSFPSLSFSARPNPSSFFFFFFPKAQIRAGPFVSTAQSGPLPPLLSCLAARWGPLVGVAPDLPTEPDSSSSLTRPRASPLPSVARTPRHPAASIKGPADPPCPTQPQPPPSRANPSRRLCRELGAPRRATVPLHLLDDITAPELLCGESKPSDPFSLSFPLARVY